MQRAFYTSLVLLPLFCPRTSAAQVSNCGGLASINAPRKVIYPAIAHAARVQGTVILMADFAPSGAVQKLDVLSGPKMLSPSAVDALRSWQANLYSGPRSCPIVVRFFLNAPSGIARGYHQEDLQHISVYADPNAFECQCSAAAPATLWQRFRNLFRKRRT